MMQNSMMLFNFLIFKWKYPFWTNLVQKIKIISWSWNLVPHFFCFWVEIPFLGKFGPKNQNYQLKLKFGTCTNSDIQNSMVIFTFSVFDRESTFWANLVQKIKIINLSWNLVPTLTRTCRIQWWYPIFLLLIENPLFGQIWFKKLKLSVQGKTLYVS